MGQRAVFIGFHTLQDSAEKATKSFEVPLKSQEVLRRLQNWNVVRVRRRQLSADFLRTEKTEHLFHLWHSFPTDWVVSQDEAWGPEVKPIKHLTGRTVEEQYFPLHSNTNSIKKGRENPTEEQTCL